MPLFHPEGLFSVWSASLDPDLSPWCCFNIVSSIGKVFFTASGVIQGFQKVLKPQCLPGVPFTLLNCKFDFMHRHVGMPQSFFRSLYRTLIRSHVQCVFAAIMVSEIQRWLKRHFQWQCAVVRWWAACSEVMAVWVHDTFLHGNFFHDRASVFQDIVAIIETVYSRALCLGLWIKERFAASPPPPPPSLEGRPVYVATFLIDTPLHRCSVVGMNQG